MRDEDCQEEKEESGGGSHGSVNEKMEEFGEYLK